MPSPYLPPGTDRIPGDGEPDHPAVALLERLAEICPALNQLLEPEALALAFDQALIKAIDLAYEEGVREGRAVAKEEDHYTPKSGAEAEELRRGVEEALERLPQTADDDHDALEERLRDVRTLLEALRDECDARDSLRWLEEFDEMRSALDVANERLRGLENTR